jgi:hypothetical protein
MSYRNKLIAAALLSLSALAPGGAASAADLPVKAQKPPPDLPFFLLIDDRLSYSWMPRGTDPGVFSINPNGTINGTTAKDVYSFTHFDVWGYGTNFFTISLFKSDHNDPANPCTNAGLITSNTIGGGFATVSADCAGASEVYGLVRSTFGWNELFNTKMFTMGPLHGISFEVGADIEVENNYLAPAKRDVVAGLQFAFDLPYKGFFNVSPLVYKEINHNSFNQCGTAFAFNQIPGVGCSLDGNTDFHPTWAVEIIYYMDLGFLPPEAQFFAISGRAGFYGPKGDSNGLPFVSAASIAANGPIGSNATKTEINSEPIRLTFDASKAILGPKYSHFVDLWVSYRYWQNKFGLDHSAELGVCNIRLNGVITSTNSCTEQTVYTGITVKF